MKLRVLVVDDSRFFRRRIVAMLDADPGIEVVGEATTGHEAIAEALRLCPDVITMDIEMPELDGISAVREIMRRQPTPILMFSSLTHAGAKATLDALEAGAVDFMPKRFTDISADPAQVAQQLQMRVRAIGRRRTGRREAPVAPVETAPDIAVAPTTPPAATRSGRYSLIVIGASTGGPVALQRVLSNLPARFSLPILLIQHMPASFTTAFAQRLNELCSIDVKEAADGDLLRPGRALLAPGGLQLGLKSRAGQLSVQLSEPRPEQLYKPSVDIAFTEAAKACPGRVLGIVLTGMGSDGSGGARLLKQTGSTVWSQDEATSVIYGMPAAVAKAGLADRILPLDAVVSELAGMG